MRVDGNAKIREILKTAGSIAVVGASPKPWRDGERIAIPSGAGIYGFIGKTSLYRDGRSTLLSHTTTSSSIA